MANVCRPAFPLRYHVSERLVPGSLRRRRRL